MLWTYPHLLWERERRPKRWPKFSLVFEFLLGRVYVISLLIVAQDICCEMRSPLTVQKIHAI